MDDFIFEIKRDIEEEIKPKKKKKKKPWMLIELFNAITVNKNLDEILKTYRPSKSDILQLIRHMSFNSDFRLYAGLLNDWFNSQNIEPSTMLKVMEKMLPKRRVFIRSSKDKKDENFLKDVGIIKDYFKINEIEAESYLNLLKQLNKYDEFMEMFEYGKVERGTKDLDF